MQKTTRRALAKASRRVNFKTSITRFASAFGTYIVLKLTRRPAFARGRYLLRPTNSLVPRSLASRKAFLEMNYFHVENESNS